MKIETFKKRFNFPVNSLSNLKFALTDGKNGKMYSLTLNKKGYPIAKKII